MFSILFIPSGQPGQKRNEKGAEEAVSAPSHLRGSAPELCTTRVLRPVCANMCLSSDVTCSARKG